MTLSIPQLKLVFAFLLLVTQALGLTCSFASQETYTVIEDGTGTKFQTGVYDAKLLAKLHSSEGKFFLVISGVSCQECDENTSIYIHSPNDGRVSQGYLGQRYSYPGTYIDNKTNKPVERVRLFVGQCLSTKQEVALWFFNSKQENGIWNRWVFFVHVEGGKVVAKEALKPYPSLTVAEIARTAGRCKEIPAKEFYTEQ
jgi:hypothetical protein